MKGQKIIITNFTDPLCTWCWGLEPVFRKLETHFPGEIDFRYVMGGLVKDIEETWDPANGIGRSDIPTINRQIEQHWNEASMRHGMPVKGKGFKLFDEEHKSSYPQNIAYKAAQMIDQKKADRFLRKMREASAADYLLTSHPDVLEDLAIQSGLDLEKFRHFINDGSAEKAFKDDLKLTRAFGVTGFPTCLVSYGEKQVLMRGYNSYEDFVKVIGMVSDDKIKPLSGIKADEMAIMDFLDTHPRLAKAEIQQAFDLTSAETQELVDKMKNAGLIEVEPVGYSYFVTKAPLKSGMVCDSVTGVCSICSI